MTGQTGHFITFKSSIGSSFLDSEEIYQKSMQKVEIDCSGWTLLNFVAFQEISAQGDYSEI